MRRARSLAEAATSVVLAGLVLVLHGCGGSATRSAHATSTHTIAPPQTRTGPPESAGRTSDFGTDVSEIFLSRSFDGPATDRQLSAAAADGLGLARAAPLWEFTEPAPPRGGRHSFDWRFDDTIAGRLAAYRFRWIAVLAHAPGWASLDPAHLHGAPRTASDFAAYAGAVAARYRGSIAAYEIWNEENSPVFWRPQPDSAAYARLYLAARAAIHRVDPGTPVLIGGLADGPPFLPELLAIPGLRGQIDGVAVHPYGADPAQVLGRVRNYRLELRSLGAGDVPLYVTEYGWATRPIGNPTWATASQQGPFIGGVAEALLRSDCGVRAVIFYAWTTTQRDPAARDQWYGIAPPSAAQTEATGAVAQAAHALLAPAGATLRLCGP